MSSKRRLQTHKGKELMSTYSCHEVFCRNFLKVLPHRRFYVSPSRVAGSSECPPQTTLSTKPFIYYRLFTSATWTGYPGPCVEILVENFFHVSFIVDDTASFTIYLDFPARFFETVDMWLDSPSNVIVIDKLIPQALL